MKVSIQRPPNLRGLAASIAVAGAITAMMMASVGALAETSPDRAKPGAALYETHCSTCHSLTLRGSAHGAPLSGSDFTERWSKAGPAALIQYNKARMPPGTSGTLSDDEHSAVVAFLFDQNNLTLDAQDLVLTESESGDAESWSGAAAVDAMARSKSGFKNRKITDFEPVTEEQLANPPAADWLSWRRTRDGHGYTPLKAVNRKNVNKLQLAWSLAMHDGSNQVTPLVHNGVMYLTHASNIIQALKADTGDLIWEYRYEFPAEARTLGGPVRNIALYENKLFMATYDAALVAVDAQTGKQLWRTAKADYREAYTHSAGPIIGDGVVLSGINGCELYTPDGCFITGHDPETGKELWRTSTIALPGDANNASWGDIPPELRGGGDSWIAGSYDPDLNLFFIGTSQAKPWVAASRGMSARDSALYTNSTLALNPRTGKIVWHFQHMAGETIDMETGFERILIEVDGKKRLYTIGKDGILWQLDAATGKFQDLAETQAQTIYAEVNKQTGRLRYRDDILNAGIGEPIKACPGIYGGHNWQSAAYSPETKSLIIPLHQLCSDLVGREVELVAGSGGYGGDSTTYPMPGVEGKLGRLSAWDVTTLEQRWNHEQRAMFLTGVLTTGGGLAFVGDVARYFSAFDVRSGKKLWQTRLGAPTHGYPISYAVDGRQYVAVPTGIGVFRAITATLYPELHQPVNGQALYVFALPE
ncbi:MAG: alcohol dehydrogenase (cytochrome c) [Halioglobus sp.]|jgi:alcohol dehydrogenase (cytochrome c)